MSKEYRNREGEVYWTDACADAAKLAIDFAVDEIDEHYERMDFLVSWRDGDVAPWPQFIALAEAAKP